MAFVTSVAVAPSLARPAQLTALRHASVARCVRRGGAPAISMAKNSKEPGAGIVDDYVFDEDNPLLPSQLNTGIKENPGFTDFSELLNGRAAMIGFVAALLIELVTGRGLIPIVQDLLP